MGENFDADAFEAFCANLAQAAFPGAPLPKMFLKVVLFSQADVEFALHAAAIALKIFPEIESGRCFFSLGNRYLPAPEDDAPALPPDQHVQQLLQDYRTLWQSLLHDPRIREWRFLPQLHVLAYSNQRGV
jgi:hypothetical protein